MKKQRVRTLMSPAELWDWRYGIDHRWGRLEHAWLLKAEGLRLEDIGKHLGVTRERARQMVAKYNRHARIATRLARWRIDDASIR